MGRVVEVYTREDGGVQPARVKTAGSASVFHRSITKICLLEDANDDEWLLTAEWHNVQIVELKDTSLRVNKQTV